MKKTVIFIMSLALASPLLSVQAKSPKKVDCSKKSLQNEIDKLKKSKANSLSISGDCNEDIVVSGHADLTLIGSGGGSITGTETEQGNNPTVLVKSGSKVRLEELTLNGGASGLRCSERSHCTLVDVTVQGGFDGIAVQDQSGIDLLGTSSIVDSSGTGIGVYGASSVNMRPAPFSDFTGGEEGTLVSGHGTGVVVIDGSFFRSDNAFIVNNEFGIFAQRNATIKIISNSDFEGGGDIVGEVSGNLFGGIAVTRASTLQAFTRIADNGGEGVNIGSLSFGQVFSEFSNNTGENIVCDHPTAVSQDDQGPGGSSTCP